MVSNWIKKWAKPPDIVWFLRNFSVLSLRQWNSHASVRFRRMCQLIELYKGLYNERTVRGLFMNLTKRYGGRLPSPIGRSFLMAAVGFCFREQGITDDEMSKTGDMICELNQNSEDQQGAEDSINNNVSVRRIGVGASCSDDDNSWELLVDRPDFSMWKRPVEEHRYLSEYKCIGTYHDISASSFFVAQMDLQYRKQWDKYVISLDVIENEDTTNSEIIRWITHFPYPMYPREYLYVRRAWVDYDSKSITLCSKAASHPAYPISDKHVRVDVYSSQMVIKPHSDFKHAGFDYILTYYDDPKAPFPAPVYRWMVRCGVPGFVDNVYHAAKALKEDSQEKKMEELSFLQQFIMDRNSAQNNRLMMSY